MPTTLPDSTYHVPSNPEDSSVEPIAPEEVAAEVQPVEPGEGLSLYRQHIQALFEAAERLDSRTTPLFVETVREFAARPGPESPELLRKLSAIGREFTQLRQAKINEITEELSKYKQWTKYRGANGEVLYAKIFADLIDEEGLIGGAVFGDPTKVVGPEAKNEEWSFYYYRNDDSGQDEYFFTRRHAAAEEPHLVLRYIVEPSVILKRVSTEVNGAKDEAWGVVQPKEAAILEFVAEQSLARVKNKLHGDPSGRHHTAN
jgi:hypothetical protein